MRFSTVISLLLHACILFAGAIFIPDNWNDDFEAPANIPVDLITQAELAKEISVPETVKAEEPVEEVVEETPPPVEEIVPPEPEPVVEETPAPEPDPIPAPVEETPEEVTPPEPKEDIPPKVEEDDLDLAGLEDALKDLEPTENIQAPSETSGEVATGDRNQARIGLGDKLSVTEVEKLVSRVSQCWNEPIGAPEPEKLRVVVSFDLNPDGTLKGQPKVENGLQISTSGNPYWKIAEREAVTAIVKCAPYNQVLPQSKYDVWKDGFTFTFATKIAGTGG